MKRFSLVMGLYLVMGAIVVSGTQAATSTVVGQLFAPDSACTAGDTFLQSGVSSGNSYVIPVAGVITFWSFQDGASPVTNLKLKVGRPAGGSTYTIVGESSAGTQTPNAVNTYPASIPVQAGDIIGIYEDGGGLCVSTSGMTGVDIAKYVTTDAAPGSTMSYASVGTARLPVSATVEQLPEVSAISPSSGPISGGTSVTISGHDFSPGALVSFGSLLATSVTVNSDNQITAISPAAYVPGSVDLRVYTRAGTTAVAVADKFTYNACVVPNLVGKKLKKAKKRLKAHDCRLGKVKGPKTGKVTEQKPEAGTALTPGGKVRLMLS
jgi:IPT/TIG domain/PASTA domain